MAGREPARRRALPAEGDLGLDGSSGLSPVPRESKRRRRNELLLSLRAAPICSMLTCQKK
jgi:hypothetical protein